MMKKMSLEVLFKDNFDPEDSAQESYVARYNGKHGLFVMSKKKLLFAEEKGFMHKNYNLLLEIPYKEIREKYIANKDKLVLTAVGGKKYTFTFHGASICALRISNILSAYLLFA